MRWLGLDRLAEFFLSTQFFLGVLWVGLTFLTITLLVLMGTRWGQSRPLRKCLLLSVLAHVLMAGYATTIKITPGMQDWSGDVTTQVTLTEEGPLSPAAAQETPPEPNPWEEPKTEPIVQPDLPDAARPEMEEPTPPERSPVKIEPPLAAHLPLGEMALPKSAASEPMAIDEPAERPKNSPAKAAEPIHAPRPQRREPSPAVLPDAMPPAPRRVDAPREEPERTVRPDAPSTAFDPSHALPRLEDLDAKSPSGDSPAELAELTPPTPRLKPTPAMLPDGPAPEPSLLAASPRLAMKRPDPALPHETPKVYQLRTHPDRQKQAERFGATPRSEAAVQAGLKWLARNQESDGRWNPQLHEGGRETFVAGHDRQGVDMRADTGMTGLALLAFLAAGHTHRDGPHQATVQKAIDFLRKAQKPDGSLAGDATPYAVMYCHAMATVALSEAYALTGDQTLEPAIRRAVDFTVAAQDPRGGGWRYQPKDPGDTSQFGWQLMAIKSAELSGVAVPDATWDGAKRYLETVSSGPRGGLASYRPGEQTTRPMTAEALACRQFLGMTPQDPAALEAADYLLAQLPGDGQDNFYYWYYGSLSLRQLGGPHWDRWNKAMQTALIARQRDSGDAAGSWDPSCLWASYGGRVYTTALATLSLEVYYRYLPLYTKTAETAVRRTTLR